MRQSSTRSCIRMTRRDYHDSQRKNSKESLALSAIGSSCAMLARFNPVSEEVIDMNHRVIVILMATVISVRICLAQSDQPTITEDFKPSTLNQPGQEYPQVNSQGYARFRIEAPEAESVRVSLGGRERGGFPLAKGEDGVWTGVTQKPLDEGFHYYHLTVDGGTFNDPGTLNFYGSTRWESGIEIPAHDQDFYALKDVPHGRVQQILFPSKSTNTLTPRLCVHAARLRQGPDQALSGAVPAARLGRG